MANVRIWGITTGVPALTDVMELQRTADGASLKATVAAIAAILPLPAAPGVDTEVLFNDATTIGAHAGLKYSKTTNTLTLGVASSATGVLKLAQASSAFLTTIQAGAALAARTYIWPTDFGSAGNVLTDAAGDGVLSWAAGGGGGTPGGSDTQVQFNDGGSAFGGNAGFTFDKTTGIVTAGIQGPGTLVSGPGSGYVPSFVSATNAYSDPGGSVQLVSADSGGYSCDLQFLTSFGTVAAPTQLTGSANTVGTIDALGYNGNNYTGGGTVFWNTTGQTPGVGVNDPVPTRVWLMGSSQLFPFDVGLTIEGEDTTGTFKMRFGNFQAASGVNVARMTVPGNGYMRLLKDSDGSPGSFNTGDFIAGVASSVTGTLQLAHASSAFLTTIQAGNAAAARTYTWPTNFGAAGTVLTDAAGDGTLSWAAVSGGSGITALTGDVAATGPGSVAATLATVNANVGTFGSATQSITFTVNGKGLVTAASHATITPAVGSITGFGTGVATALAINVGSAGAPVTLNGALGTPSSGTLTNATGLPAAGVVGTAAILGANTFTGNQTISGAALITSGNFSVAAWTTSGVRVKHAAASYTDTSSSGTVAAAYTDLHGAGTILASSATTFTDYYGAWFADPVASTNVTMTNKHSLGLEGSLKLPAGATATPSVRFPDSSGKLGIFASTTFAVVVSQDTNSVGLGFNGVNVCSGASFSWGATFDAQGAKDTSISRAAAGSVNFSDTANGKALGIKMLTELLIVAAAATSTTTIQKPANSIILAVSVRVTTVIPTATTFDVGDSTLATRFSTASVSVAANTTDKGTKAGAYYNATAEGIILTMNGGTPAANTGRVRVTIYYIEITPPTS